MAARRGRIAEPSLLPIELLGGLLVVLLLGLTFDYVLSGDVSLGWWGALGFVGLLFAAMVARYIQPRRRGGSAWERWR